GSAQHGDGGAGDLSVRAGCGIDPQGSELTFGNLGAGLMTDLRTDRRVDVDPGPVAVAAEADEADVGGTVVADEAGVGKDGGERRAYARGQIGPAGDDELESAEPIPAAVGRLGEGLDDGGDGDDPSDRLGRDPGADR